MNNLQSIVSHFNTKGTVNEIQPLGSGLINDTYKVTTLEADAPDYVLQRINHAIFQNVEMLQANIEAVTRHIRRNLWSRVRKILTVKCFLSFPPIREKHSGMMVRTIGVS